MNPHELSPASSMSFCISESCVFIGHGLRGCSS
jgi:hypothetical protein